MKNKISLMITLSVIFAFLLGAFTPLPADMISTQKTETGANDHWKLADIYPDQAAWEADYKDLQSKLIPNLKTYQGKMGDKNEFLGFMKANDFARRMNEKLSVFAHMSVDVDTSNSQLSEIASRIDALSTQLGEATAFFNPELISLPQAKLQSYLNDPDLKEYRMSLQSVIELKPHILSAPEEALLAKAGNISSAASVISEKIREADLQFPKIEDPQGNLVQVSEELYIKFMSDPDRSFRERAYNARLNTYGSMKNSLAAALDAQMRADYFYATTGKYQSSLDASLSYNHIPVSVYTSLLETTHKNLPVLHKYISYRKKILGVDKIRAYDMFIPLVKNEKAREFSYTETQAILAKALKPAGEDYIQIMQAGFNDGWVDVYPSESKKSGAYAWGSYDTHPYILLNYDGTLDGVLTTAHEMGHAIAGYFANKARPYIDSNIPIFTNEMASTTNEFLTLRYLINQAQSDTEKITYLNQLLESIRGTFFVQTMYAEFELAIHERIEKGDALSVDWLNQIWGDLLQKYYGPDYEVTDAARLGWASIPHFYDNFYVYQYATGISAASEFSKQLLSGDKTATARYRTFLEAGSSEYPIEILKKAGLDMLSGQPVNGIIDIFNQTIEQMQVLMK